MLETYNEIFSVYLDICKKKYNPEKPYDNLDKRVERCRAIRWELLGMVRLMRESGCITMQQEKEENERIIETFDEIKLYNAYSRNGQIMVFRQPEQSSSMSEDPHEF